MIDVIVAEHEGHFRLVLEKALTTTDDFRMVGRPHSPEQLLSILEAADPHLLIMSTDFLPAFPRIQLVLRKRQTALLVVAEDDDHVSYSRWLQARGVLYRSMNGVAMVDAMRRVARGELLVQRRSTDKREKRILYVCYDLAVLVSHERLLQSMGYQVCTVLGQDGLQALKSDVPFDLALIGDEGSLAQQQRAARLLNELQPHACIIALRHGAEKAAGANYCVSSGGPDIWPDSVTDSNRHQSG